MHVILKSDQFKSQAKSDWIVEVNNKTYYLGKALSVNEKRLVKVLWYNDCVQTYRAGYEDTFDLFVFDSIELEQIIEKHKPKQPEICECGAHLLQKVSQIEDKAVGIL